MNAETQTPDKYQNICEVKVIKINNYIHYVMTIKKGYENDCKCLLGTIYVSWVYLGILVINISSLTIRFERKKKVKCFIVYICTANEKVLVTCYIKEKNDKNFSSFLKLTRNTKAEFLITQYRYKSTIFGKESLMEVQYPKRTTSKLKQDNWHN